jgi:hypothetical protein
MVVSGALTKLGNASALSGKNECSRPTEAVNEFILRQLKNQDDQSEKMPGSYFPAGWYAGLR